VDEFLPPALLEELSEQAAKAPLSAAEQHPSGYKFSAAPHPELFRHLFRFVGRELPRYLPQRYQWSSIYKLPQMYRARGPWPGLEPHTDNQPGRHLAAIIYISDGWEPACGGELHLYDWSAGKLTFSRAIQPIRNRAVFLPLGEGSWHGVAPIQRDWERTTIIQDWQRTTE
jgi:hypothetical protein